MTATTARTEDVLLSCRLRPAYFTIARDLVEDVVAVAAGLIASSIVPIGFGLDSGIEVCADIPDDRRRA
jgi:hypothetical protein